MVPYNFVSVTKACDFLEKFSWKFSIISCILFMIKKTFFFISVFIENNIQFEILFWNKQCKWKRNLNLFSFKIKHGKYCNNALLPCFNAKAKGTLHSQSVHTLMAAAKHWRQPIITIKGWMLLTTAAPWRDNWVLLLAAESVWTLVCQ